MIMRNTVSVCCATLGLLTCSLLSAGAVAAVGPDLERVDEPRATPGIPAELQLAAIRSRARHADDAYHIGRDGHGTNPRHGFDLAFTPHGAVVNGRGDAFALRLDRIGRGRGASVRPVMPEIDGAWVEYDHGSGVREWFVNLPQGVEQGWLLAQRPPGSGPLALELETGRVPEHTGDGRRLAWSGLTYHQLVAVDASGRTLPATWATDGSRLRIEVEDRGADYPILVDPWLQETKLVPSEAKDLYRYGFAIDIDGDTAIIGAPGPNGSRLDTPGEAYIYTRVTGIWTESARLVASDAHDLDWFGWSVALDGDTALVGKPDAGGDDEGAVHVFQRSQEGEWIEQTKLTASDGAPGWVFGGSVDLVGDVALVGAWSADIGEEENQGAAYVFERSGSEWIEQQRLVASDGHGGNTWGLGDTFGWQVDLSGDAETALIAAPFAKIGENTWQGAAYVFSHTAEGWAEEAKLTASDGEAGHEFGARSALSDSGDTTIFGVPKHAGAGPARAGAAYVFSRSGGTWTEQEILFASDPETDAAFGISVAITEGTAVIGALKAPHPDYPPPGGENENKGAAYVFTRGSDGWTEQTKLVPAEDPNDGPNPEVPAPSFFGSETAIDGDAIMVTAASGAAPGAVFPGSVYTYFDPPANYGIVQGSASSLHPCSAEVFGLPGATVEIAGAQGTYTVETGRGGFLDRGFFRIFLPEEESPLDITITAPDHLSDSVEGIDFMGGDTVDQDFDLVLQRPCATAAPNPLTTELTAGETGTATLTLGNVDGTVDLSWELSTAVPTTARDTTDTTISRETGPAEVAVHQDASRTTGANRATDASRTTDVGHTVPGGGPATAVDLASALKEILPGIRPIDSAGSGGGPATSVDLASALGETLPGIRPIDPAGGAADCDDALTLALHDDGTIENAYSSDANVYEEAMLVDRFTPSAYPSSFRSVCLSFMTAFGGPSSLDFEIVVFDDDGPDGGPGTLLGSLPARIADLPLWPISEPVWSSFDIASLDITIDSGSVYIGARWPLPDPDEFSANVWLSTDESLGYPPRPVGLAGGYHWDDITETWTPIEEAHDLFARYRSLFVRAVENPGGCLDPSELPWLAATPASGTTPVGETSEVQVTLDATGMAPGEYDATVCLATNDPDRRVLAAAVTLTVTPAPLDLAFDPAALDFGDVDVGTSSSSQTVTLRHSGEVAATGLAFSSSSGAFEIDAGACGDTLPVGGTCPVTVTFAPTEVGPVEGILEVTNDQAVTASVALTGRGIAETTPMALAVDSEPRASDGNGVLESGEVVDVAPAWRNDAAVPQSLHGGASELTGPGGADYTLVVDAADYGALEAGQAASCRDTGVCYVVSVESSGGRPATHWDATFQETLSNDIGTTWDLHIGGSFADVPATNLFYPAIETLLHSGVTGGCSGSEYCPGDANNRAQMPVFMLKALEGPDYTPPACVEGDEPFDDVPASSPFCPWIQELANRDIVAGCGGGNYCPGNPVTRAQMAIFLLKTLEGSDYTPPECTGRFTDVPCSSLFAEWIEDLAMREITGGCSATEYCPGDEVSRAQMAAFIVKAFGFSLYGP